MAINGFLGTIGLVDISFNKNYNSPILTPKSKFIRTINGFRRNIIYYDPDIFDETVLLSASLLIGQDEIPWKEHYNTTHDEDTGISGTDWKPLEDITIAIYPRPKRTQIKGLKRMDVGSTQNYFVPNTYDISNNFTYDWYIEGSALFTNNNSTTYLNAGKNVNIIFNDIDTITLKLKITNQAGCFRWIIRNLYSGTATKQLLVVRYPYF